MMPQGDNIDFQLELVPFIPHSWTCIRDIIVHIESRCDIEAKIYFVNM